MNVTWTASTDNVGVTGYRISEQAVRLQPLPQQPMLIQDLLLIHHIHIRSWPMMQQEMHPPNQLQELEQLNQIQLHQAYQIT